MTDENSLTDEFIYERVAMRPTPVTWIKHIALLLVTLLTATIAGSLYPFGPINFLPNADPQTWGETANLVFSIPIAYGTLIAFVFHELFTNQALLIDGLCFSISLLFILTSHEMGHYVACRLYGVDATLPYFIPTPPLIGPAGTFGAFIKIQSPMPSRRAVFDIGVSGPIAGFIALIPIAIIGVATMHTVTPEQLLHFPPGIVFSDPLLMKLAAFFFGIDLHLGIGNPFYYAAWVGLLVTALNLIPSGQLDGGHAIYAALGEQIHKWTGRVAFVVMAALSIAGWFFYNSPSGFLIAVLLGVMMRIKHPEPYDQTPLDSKRKLIAFVTLAIFVLCFAPFPIQIN